MATVAIATRMAPRFLPESLLNTGSWRYEQATEKYFYGVDLSKPWEIQIFEQTDFHDPKSWKLMDAKDLMQRAYESLVKIEREVQVGPAPEWHRKRLRDELTNDYFVCGKDERWPWNNVREITHQTIQEVGIDPEEDEAMQACSIIAMSQGFAALQVEGPGPISAAPEILLSPCNFEELEVDVFSVPSIYTTKSELFRYG